VWDEECVLPGGEGEGLVADPGDGGHDPVPLHTVHLLTPHIHLLVLVCSSVKEGLKGLPHEMNLTFDDMYG
jgi:hypothetical protein